MAPSDESYRLKPVAMPARFKKHHSDVLELLCRGLRNAEIGCALGMSERSVKAYVTQLLLMFDVSNRTELVGMVGRVGGDVTDI